MSPLLDPSRLLLIQERDVGLFSMVLQVINTLDALEQHGIERVPVALFGRALLYFHPEGHDGRRTVWEYYFEPLVPGAGEAVLLDLLGERALDLLESRRKQLELARIASEGADPVPPMAPLDDADRANLAELQARVGDRDWAWTEDFRPSIDDREPSDGNLSLERGAELVRRYLRPRARIRRQAEKLYRTRLAGHYVIGVHVRGTDGHGAPARGIEIPFEQYYDEIDRRLDRFGQDGCRVFLATDEQAIVSRFERRYGALLVCCDTLRKVHGDTDVGRGPTGQAMPAYITQGGRTAVRNGEEVVLEYLLLTRAHVLVHNVSSISRVARYSVPESVEVQPEATHPVLATSPAPGPAPVADRGRIFVGLAAYREPELRLTIEDCLDKARHPERLRFGVCLQYEADGVPEVREDCIDALLLDDRFRASKHDQRDSRGGCWARHIAQRFYDGEEYTLQVDAHARLVPEWDEKLVRMMHDLPAEKPLITGSPPLYLRENGRDVFPKHEGAIPVPTTFVTRWSCDGWLDHPAEVVARNTALPRRTRVISGGFVFTLGAWNREVRQDPQQLYTGEEFALTLRSFTWGYDLFNPDEVVVFHRSHPQPNPKYVTDFPEEMVQERHRTAMKRLATLLAGDPQRELGSFSLGPQRSLHDYYLFSGLDCERRTIHPDAIAGVPPDPLTITPAADSRGAGPRTRRAS